MFDNLTSRLNAIFDRLRGYGRLTEENVQEAPREVRVALLEADVNFKVVKGFIERVRAKAIGQDVLTSLTPGQHVVKVVRDELVGLLGGSGPHAPPPLPEGRPASDAGVSRRVSSRCHRSAEDPGREPRTARAGRSRRLAGGDLPSGPGRGRAAWALAADPGHRRASAHRRGDARRAEGDQEGCRPASH